MRSERGLTLIELILTLSILAIAGALVSGALQTSLRAWESGFATGREELIAQVVLERLATQLRAVVASPARRVGAAALAFDAGEGKLRFVTLAAAGDAPVQVSYALESGPDGERFVYREFPWPDKDFFGEHRARREEVVPDVVGFAVKLKKRPDEEAEEGTPPPPGAVVEEWVPTDLRLPQTVTIDLAVRAARGAEKQTYQVAVTLPDLLAQTGP